MNDLGDTTAGIKAGKKVAIVVGIDKYDDKEITKLEGAEHDAKELFELLTSQAAGFVNEDKNLLINEQANHRDILDRISEVFRQDEEFDIALFYFSGHGFVDKKNDLYLSTYEVKKKDPYVGGIKVDDLRNQIYSSENKRNAIIVLDCCYSGVATEDTRGGETIKDLTPLLDRNIGNIKDRNYGTGKFIISSSANDQVSYEKKNCTHYGDDKEPHPHGAFTYYFIEGLRGGAADETSGEITLFNLQQYINQKLADDKKQNSYINVSEGSNLPAIRIALSVDKFDYYITSLEKTIKERFPEGDSSFPSISYISDCAKKLKELKSQKPDNPQIPAFNDLLSSKIDMYVDGVLTWGSLLPDDVKIKIEEELKDRGLIENFLNYVSELNLDTIVNNKTDAIKSILSIVGEQVKIKNGYANDKDPKLIILLRRLKPAYQTYKRMIGTTSS